MEAYISYKTALLAREKGLTFDLDDGGNCACYHMGDPKWHFQYHVHYQYPNKEEYLFAPTQAYLQRFLRKVFNIQVYVISATKNGEEKYKDYVAYINGVAINDARDEEYQEYEDAMEFGLETALKRL